MLATEHEHFTEPTKEKASAEDIARLLAEREGLEASFGQALDDLSDSVDGEAGFERFDQLTREFVAHQDEVEESNAYDYVLWHSFGAFSDETRAALRKCSQLEARQEQIKERLNELAGKELSDYARTEAARVIDRIDYSVAREVRDKNLSLPNTDGVISPGGIGRILTPFEISRNLNEIKLGNFFDEYEVAEGVLDTIEMYEALLERWGALRPEGSESRKYPEVDEEIVEASELNNEYRTFHNEYPVHLLPEKGRLPIYEWAVDLSDEEHKLLTKHLASLDKEREIRSIAIEGLDESPVRITEQYIQHLFRQVPALALEGIDRIVFKPRDEKTKAKDARSKLWDGKSVTMAHHDHSIETNSAEIVIWTDVFRGMLHKYHETMPITDAALLTLIAIKETILHELGHALHNKLPVALLHDWDTAARAENVDVTDYVKQTREHEDSHYILEDFADTFRLLKTDPQLLLGKASKRFIAMNNIVAPIS